MRFQNGFLAIFLMALLPALASGFELSTSTDAVSASWCTQATASARVDGAPAGSVVYFSLESGYINAVVEKPQLLPDAFGGAETRIILSVPQCYLGAQDVMVTAQVCTGFCETKTRKIRVDASSCLEVQCAYVVNAGTTNVVSPSPQPTSLCGGVPCSEVVSSIVREREFKPTGYEAVLQRSTLPRCISYYGCGNDQVRQGEALAVQFKARNFGAAGSFEVAGIAQDAGALSVYPKSVSLELSRGESEWVDFTVLARPGALPGVYKVWYKVSHGGVELDSYTQFVEVVGERPAAPAGEAKLVVPPEIVLSTCTPVPSVSVPVSLETSGRTQEFDVSATLRGQTVFAQRVLAPERTVKNFELSVDYAKLAVGENLLQVSASSQEFAGSGAMRIVLLACATPSPVPSPRPAFDFSGFAGNKITIVTTVVNEGSELLPSVYGELTGLPALWNYSTAVINVPPKSEANLTIIVLATTQESASPTLVIKSGSRVLMIRPLGEINKQSSLTGFLVTTVSENLAILLVVMAVLAAAFLYLAARNQDEQACRLSKRAKVTNIKREVFFGGTTG